jgi:hypothetical protein
MKREKNLRIARNIFNRNKSNDSRTSFVAERAKYNKAKKRAKQSYRKNEGLRVSQMARKQPK